MNHYTLVEARRDHPEWFSRGTMNFFNTELDREYHADELALYLVYSNRYDETSERHWHVMSFDADGTTLLGPVDGVGTKHRARVIAEGLAARERGRLIRPRSDAKVRFKPCPRCEARGVVPGWATWEQRYPMNPGHAVEQWLDVCSEHIIEAANVVGVVA